MEINLLVGTLDAEDGLKIRKFALLDTTETARTFRTKEGRVILKSSLLKPEKTALRWQVYCAKEDHLKAREILSNTILDDFKTKRDELDKIEAAITDFSLCKRQVIMEADPIVTKLLEENATVIYGPSEYDEVGSFYFLPFWYERIGENEFKVHKLTELPLELKRKKQMFKDLAEGYPELREI